MSKDEISQRLKIMAYLFLILGTVLFIATGFYIIINARYNTALGSSLLIDVDLVKRVLKSTSTLFFVFIPIMAIAFICSAVQLFRLGRLLDNHDLGKNGTNP